MKTITILFHRILPISVSALMVFVLYCCSKKSNDPNPDSPQKEQKIDVYIADNENNPTTDLLEGKVYKNGELLYNHGEAGKNILINGMDISYGKVYAAGTSIKSNSGTNSYTSRMWENNTNLILLGVGINGITDMLKSGNDVYYSKSDYTDNKTQIWKNSDLVYEIPLYYATKIALSGNDIYTCGVNKNNQPVVMKNSSILYTLSNSDGFVNTFWLDGSTVYSAGNTGNIAKVWKNGDVLYSLGNGDASDICVSGNTVYISGATYDNAYNSTAKVWKNGNILYTLSNGNAGAAALSVGLVGNDVYAAGIDNGSCKVWKNGELLYTMGNKANMQTNLRMKLVPQQ